MIVLDSIIRMSKINAGKARWEIVRQAEEEQIPGLNVVKIKNAKTVDDVFEQFGISILGIENEDGSYDAPISLSEENPEILQIKLQCIAPFVKTGSYIEIVLYGELCRYYFWDGKVYYQTPEIRWKNMKCSINALTI